MHLLSEDQRRLQIKLEALESILLELLPFEVPFVEHEIRAWYDARFAVVNSAEPALRAVFQEKASKVLALLATVSGSREPDGLLELLISAATVVDEPISVRPEIKACCLRIIKLGCAEEPILQKILLNPDLNDVEARCLCASISLTAAVVEEATYSQQLRDIISVMRTHLDGNDPFLQQAIFALSAVEAA